MGGMDNQNESTSQFWHFPQLVGPRCCTLQKLQSALSALILVNEASGIDQQPKEVES